MKILDVFVSDKFKALERKLIVMFLILAVYFLGTWSMQYTSNQVKEYAKTICNLYEKGDMICYYKNSTDTFDRNKTCALCSFYSCTS